MNSDVNILDQLEAAASAHAKLPNLISQWHHLSETIQTSRNKSDTELAELMKERDAIAERVAFLDNARRPIENGCDTHRWRLSGSPMDLTYTDGCCYVVIVCECCYMYQRTTLDEADMVLSQKMPLGHPNGEISWVPNIKTLLRI